METDPIVEEVRRARYEHAAQFNFDIDKICDDLEKEQMSLRKRVVSFPPKQYLKKTGT